MAYALHRVGRRGVAELYIGPNPLGPKGGRCGGAVDAVWAAEGVVCRKLCSALALGLEEEVVLATRGRLKRPITAKDLPRKFLGEHILQWHAVLHMLGT